MAWSQKNGQRCDWPGRRRWGSGGVEADRNARVGLEGLGGDASIAQAFQEPAGDVAEAAVEGQHGLAGTERSRRTKSSADSDGDKRINNT